MVACNFLAAGPSVSIVNIAIDFAKTPGNPKTYLGVWIPKVAYFFTGTSLSQGVGNFIWMPLINKYGRRPVYVGTFTCYTFMALWSGLAASYASELAARILMGLFAGSGECLAPLTIADIFFLHERGTIMASAP
jgi:MFS family permease